MANNSEDTDSVKSKSAVKVVDRRRFNSDGEEKLQVTVATKEAATKETATKEIPMQPEDKKNGADMNTLKKDTALENKSQQASTNEDAQQGNMPSDMGDISFESFVLSLATQAMMLLGQIKPPDGVPLAVDPDAAKQSIDILSMLELKTKGNLNAQENKLLKDALHNLRISYLKFS